METLPSVKHQLVSLDVFPEDECVRGYCEITAVCPKDKQVLGLHTYELDIKRISVDGREATFELRPHFEEALPEQVLDGPSGGDMAAVVADHAFFQYERTLQREYNPELIIHLPSPQSQPSTENALALVVATDGRDDIAQQDSLAQSSAAVKEEAADLPAASQQPAADGDVQTAVVRVEYELQPSTTGLCFQGSYAHTNNQLRRARAWMPCVDAPNAAHPYDIHITVAKDQTAVASGQLLKQRWTAQHRKKFYFNLPQATVASQIAFAVGPFAIVSGTSAPPVGGAGDAGAQSSTVVTHLAPHSRCPDLEHTVKFFPVALSLFEGQLGASFPFPSYHQVFVPSESIGAEAIVGAGICIASTDLLFNDRTIEQAVDSMLALVRALAQQWFGVWLRPKAPSDEWLLQGLCMHLTNLFIGKYLGRNEILYRRQTEKEAIYAADDGSMPPLHLLQRSERHTKIAAYPWGALHATEDLGPGADFRQMKAAAVVHMLERRAGEDNFKRLQQRLLAVSQNAAATGGLDSRLLTTMDFLREVAKIGGIRHEVSAIYKRWVSGRGCPKITGAYFYNRKRSVLELAIHQSGNAASKAAAEDASGSGKEGSSAGILKVLVKESEGPVEHLVKVGTHAKVLEELRVVSKPAKVKNKPGRRKQKVAVEDLDEDAAEPEEHAGEALPVEWVRLDPGNELIALIRLRQPETVLAAQLERSKDVLAQSAAIVGLATIRPVTYGVVNALRACMQNSNFYCRVRMEAAMALGQVAGQSPEATGLDHLLRFCQSRLFDASLGMPAAWQFADLAEHYLTQALPLALAAAKDAKGNAFKDALELLLDVLEHVDNSGNIYNPDNFLAAALEALGRMHTDDAEMREAVLRQLQRYWKREFVMPSRDAIVGCAALRSMTAIVRSHGSDATDRQRLLIMLAKCGDHSHKYLRRCSLQCSIRVTYCAQGLDSAIRHSMKLLRANKSPRDRRALMEEMLFLLPADEKALGAISKESLAELHGMLSWHGNPELRHLAFVALMRLGRQAPTLFRKDDDPAQDATAAPSMSVDTGYPRQLPAASGPAVSLDSGGKSSRRPFVLKLKTSFLGAPSKSQKTAAPEESEERSVGAARPSAAGLKTEPSVSQPPPPSAAALEQEVVSSPLHPAGQAETQAKRPSGLKIKQSWAKPPMPSPAPEALPQSLSQRTETPSSQASQKPKPRISFKKRPRPDAEGPDAPRKRFSVTLPGTRLKQHDSESPAGGTMAVASTSAPVAEPSSRAPSPSVAAVAAASPSTAEQLHLRQDRSEAAAPAAVSAQTQAGQRRPKARTPPAADGAALPASSAPAQQKPSAKQKRSPSPLHIPGSAAPDAKVQQSAGTQKGRPKSGSKEKKAPALSTEQEQAREAMLRDVMAIASKAPAQAGAPAPKKAKASVTVKGRSASPLAPSPSPTGQALPQLDLAAASGAQPVGAGSLPSRTATASASAEPGLRPQSSASAARPGSLPAAVKPKFKVKLGQGTAAGPLKFTLPKSSSRAGSQASPTPGASAAGPASTPAAASAPAPAKPALKVRFSGVKAPAAASTSAPPEAKQELSKEEERKRARLRKAQKALGL